MTVKELKTYLDKYPDGEEVRFFAADIKKRIAWPNYQIGVIGITDASAPVIALELHESEPFDGELIQEAEVAERNSMWIPVDDWIIAEECLPEPEKLVLLSLRNSDAPMIGRYTIDDVAGDGIFRIGYGDDSFADHNLFINAWMPLPEPYREEM